MKLMRSVGLLLSIAIIAPAFAASPDVKDWEHSPQAYFMTKAEQREWTEIKTQEEAQRFIVTQMLEHSIEALRRFLEQRVPLLGRQPAMPAHGMGNLGHLLLKSRVGKIFPPRLGIVVHESIHLTQIPAISRGSRQLLHITSC